MLNLLLFHGAVVFGLAVTSGSAVASGEAVDHSARRDPAISFHPYLERTREITRRATPRFGKLTRAVAASEQATAFVSASGLRPAPEWESEAVMLARFRRMRDARVLHSDGSTPFARRATWLYPDDGCFTRAALGVQSLAEAEPGAPTPGKIFVFGNLRVRTPNSPNGLAYWWYHVAPVVRVGPTNYVLDPSIDARRPLTVDEWIGAQSDVPESTQVAVCGGGTYGPSDRCDLGQLPPAATPLADGLKLLKFEWDRLIDLARDPRAELGERPPWL